MATTYYRLLGGDLTLHISRTQLKAIQRKISAVLRHSARGHREYYVGVFFQGRHWGRLQITTHAAHRRHCAARA